MSILRAETLLKIRKGIREGIGATRLYGDLRAVGPVTRKTDFLADYRNIAQIEDKKDLLKYVRKDRYPTEKIIATTTWALDKEFMYVVRLKTQFRPDEPVLEHDVSIQTDAPMTPAMIEARVIEERIKEEKYLGEIVYEVTPTLAFRRI